MFPSALLHLNTCQHQVNIYTNVNILQSHPYVRPTAGHHLFLILYIYTSYISFNATGCARGSGAAMVKMEGVGGLPTPSPSRSPSRSRNSKRKQPGDEETVMVKKVKVTHDDRRTQSGVGDVEDEKEKKRDMKSGEKKKPEKSDVRKEKGEKNEGKSEVEKKKSLRKEEVKMDVKQEKTEKTEKNVETTEATTGSSTDEMKEVARREEEEKQKHEERKRETHENLVMNREESRSRMVLMEAVMKHEVLVHMVTRTLEVQENLSMAMEDKEAQLIWWAVRMHQMEEEKAKKNDVMNDERRQFMEVMKQDMKTLQKMDEDLKRIRKMEEEMARIYWVMKGEHKKFLEEMASQRQAFEEQRKVEEAEMKRKELEEREKERMEEREKEKMEEREKETMAASGSGGDPETWKEWSGDGLWARVPLPNPPIWPDVVEEKEIEMEEVEVEEEVVGPRHVPPPERRPKAQHVKPPLKISGKPVYPKTMPSNKD